jgi:hypothetical protein
VTFWQVFFTLMIFIPLLLLWVFTLIDLFQRVDLSGAAKALWAIAIVLLPFIGMLVYFILRDSQASPPPIQAPAPAAATEVVVVGQRGAAELADQLERLAELRDKAILSDEEFQREKDKMLGYDIT